MPVELKWFVQEDFIDTMEYYRVSKIADQLLEYLNSEYIQSELEKANQPHVSSFAVQSVFREYAEKLGFKSEKGGLFKDYYAMNMRPDYYLPLDDTGIILEVERGKTTINNMDILDFWKCHLCDKAPAR